MEERSGRHGVPRGAVLFALVVVLLLGLSPLFGTIGLGGGSVPHAPSAPVVVTRTAANSGHAALVPRPQINCNAQPGYAPVTSFGLYPPYPSVYFQAPCQLADPTLVLFHDEAHVSYSSSQSGTAARVTIPISLPIDSANADVSMMYNDFTASMIVSGDARSVDNQSIAQVYFIPTGSYNYEVVASVWSLYNNTKGVTCNGQNITWNNSYACESELLGSGHGAIRLGTSVSGGTLVDVTFVGQAHSTTSPLTIYVNASGSPVGSVVLDPTNTNGFTLAPAFDASCPISCFVNWTQSPFGLGFGADLCLGSCYSSWDEPLLNSTNPVTLAPPEAWNGSAYSNEYSIIATDSLSGDCEAISNVICPPGTYNGFYPDFTFNGSDLNFGVEPTWTVNDFGGSTHQFQTSGSTTDFNPEFLLQVTNTSHGSFTTGTPQVNVTAHAAVFGNYSELALSYRLPDGTTGNLSMNGVSGTRANGNWTAALPVSSVNGPITYRVWATDRAGTTIVAPAAGAYVVNQVGTIPTFQVVVDTVPGGCGGVVLNGTHYASGSTASIAPGNYTLNATVCYPYVFDHWQSAKGGYVWGGIQGWYLVSANTTIIGVWDYVRPHDLVRVAFGPGACGTVYLNNTAYSSAAGAANVLLFEHTNFSLTESPCAQQGFSGWTAQNAGNGGVGNLTILGSNLYTSGNGTITYLTLPTASAYDLTVYTSPGGCGGVLIRSAAYTNDSQLWLAPGVGYPIHEDPCYGYGFRALNTTGGATIASGLITLTKAGSVTEENYLLTLLALYTSPTTCGGINFDGSLYADGTILNLTPNSLHQAFGVACTTPLYHFVGFSVTGGISIIGNTVTANSSGSLTANFQPGPPTTFLGFETSPATCGGILFEGVEYLDTNFTHVSPNTAYTISPVPCAGFGFVAWQVFGGVQVDHGIAYVNFSGTVKAIFHPLDPLYLHTVPSYCGAIVVAGIAYTDNASIEVPVEDEMSLAAVPCAGYGFSHWTNTSDGILGANSLTILAGTILTAYFVPLHYAVTLLIAPYNCGGVRVGGGATGAVYANNTTLQLLAGTYAVTPVPCAGNAPIGSNTTGNVSLNGTVLTVTGVGTLLLSYGPVPPTLTLSAPSGSYTGEPVSFDAVVAVPVPPYSGYTYSWDFGDGINQATISNLTAHTFAHPGIYRVTVTVHDPYARTANATTTITVTPPPVYTTYGNLTPLDWGIIVGAIAAVGALLAIGRRRNDRPPKGESSAAPPPEGIEAASAAPALDGTTEPVDGEFAKVQEPPAYSTDVPEGPP